MKLLILLHGGPNDNDSATAVRIAETAIEAGDEVSIFAMSAGVMNLAVDKFMDLLKSGVEISVCEHNRRGFKAPEGIEGIIYGSQFDLAGYVADSDRVVSLI